MSFSPAPPGPPSGSSIQEQRDLWERKRSVTVKELVKTEQRYCQQLELVTTYFLEILKAKGTLKENVRESVFSSIRSILSANQSLLVHLENGFLSRGFDVFCPQLHHYNVYADNFYTAAKTLAVQMRKNKAFRRFKTLQESRPEFRDQKLEDLLHLPLQRIHQYDRFLRGLASNTSPDHEDFRSLTRAVTAVSDVSQRIHDNGRRHDNQQQLLRIQKLLKGNKTRVERAGRWFLREGWLDVVPSKGTEVSPRMFFLFSDLLLETRRVASLGFSKGPKFVGQRAFPLKDCTVEKVFGHTRSRGGLLSLSFPKAKLLLMSNNQEELNEWNESLSNAVRKLQSKPTSVHHVVQSDDSNNDTNRKRNLVSSDSTEHAQTSADCDVIAPKRLKQNETEENSSESSSCVIL